MDAASWLCSLQPLPGECRRAGHEGQSSTEANSLCKTGFDGQGAGFARPEEDTSEDDRIDAQRELVAMGFPPEAAASALATSGGDLDEALSALVVGRARHSGKKRTRASSPSTDDGTKETLEIEGVQCRLTAFGELVLDLPHSPTSIGPVVGRDAKDGSGMVFDGMDDWLWELYESRPPRIAELPSSFNTEDVTFALDRGAPFVWDSFASPAEIQSAHAALDAMFTRRELSRGSDSWVDECAEGGHARNRRTLQGQRRGDACGFWNLFGEEPEPPAAVLLLFRRLEAAGQRLRTVGGERLLVSHLGMGAVYDGRGACYAQHRDNEWQRLLQSREPRKGARSRRAREATSRGAWMNFREVTMLAYVNLPGEFTEDEEGRRSGGRLRCYVDTKRGDLSGFTAQEQLDVAPLGGRAVIFRSRELLHEVLPSFARRYCLTLWFCTGFGERE